MKKGAGGIAIGALFAACAVFCCPRRQLTIRLHKFRLGIS
jgi:hypothetical protein